LGHSFAVSRDTQKNVSYTLGNGEPGQTDNILKHFNETGSIPNFPLYDQKFVGVGALYTNLAVGETPITIVSFRAIGKTLADAKANLARAINKNATGVEQQTNSSYYSWLNSSIKPDLADDALDLYKKSLLVLKNSQNPRLGTIASSLHPLYGYKNWMRDSIMAGFMLDAAGFHKEAKLFFDWVPTAPLTNTGGWHTCYNTFTGKEVGFVEPQYDSVGIYLMAMNYHLHCFGDSDWIKSHMTTIEREADWIVQRKGDKGFGYSDRAPWEESTDHHTGLPVPEQYYTWTQGNLYGGLIAAARIEEAMGNRGRAVIYMNRSL
jgi:GH15 family glucan-1,4-alpha-glucosidase